jgi:PKD repeat protein
MSNSATRRWIATLGGSILLGLCGSPSADAASWLTPRDVSDPQAPGAGVACGLFAGQPAIAAVDVAVNARGDAVAVWTQKQGTTQTVQAAVRPPGGNFSAPQAIGVTLPCFFLGILGPSPKVGIDAQGNAIAVWAKPLAASNVIQAAVRPAGGTFGPANDISDPSRTANTDPDIAMSATGSAVAVWSWNDGSKTVIQVATRPAGGSFPAAGAATTISASGQNATNPRVAMNDRGDTAVVWTRTNGTNVIAQARVRPAGSTFAATVDLSAAGADAGSPDVAIDPAGRATAVWTRSNLVESRFLTSAGALDGGIDNVSDAAESVGSPSVALDDANNAVAVWTGGTLTKAASRASRASFAPPQTVSSPGDSNALPRVAMDRAGNAVAIWSQGLAVVQASRRAPGGTFGGVEDVSKGGSAVVPTIGVDDEGNAIVGYAFARAAPDGRLVAQVATYDVAPPILSDISVPTAATVGENASMSANAADRWSGASISWSFGDGSTGAGATVSHAYTAAGNYTVSVTATDGAGNASSTTRTVQVAAPPTGGGGGGGSAVVVPAGIDSDRDGFFAGQDCNDNNAGIRPGAVEVKGNNLDENCDGLAEPFPTITSGVASKWDVKGSRLTLTALQVTQQFPKGWKAKIFCRGSKCPFKSKNLKAGKVSKGAATIITSLSKKQRKFRAGQTLEVWISAPNFNTKVSRLVLKKGKIPTTQPFCVLPGQTKVQKTCS